MGNTRTHNIALLGAASALIGDVPPEIWLQAVEEWVPRKYAELNRQAFETGRRAGLLQD